MKRRMTEQQATVSNLFDDATALHAEDGGIKMDLFDRVTAFSNLVLAGRDAIRAKKHTPAARELFFDLEGEVLRLQRRLLDGSWTPGPFRTFTVCEPKERRIAAAPLADRVVHHAICRVLGPLFERWSICHSYACRPGKGSHAAIQRARALVGRTRYFLKCDVAKFFDSVDHETLQNLLGRRFGDGRLMALLRRIIVHGPPGCEPGKGIPIGNLTSQHFANFYLGPLDRALCSEYGESRYTRYMDDFLLFAQDKETLHRAKALAERTLAESLRLRLKPEATTLAPVGEGVPFLGLRIYPGTVRLSHAAWSRSKRGYEKGLRELDSGLAEEAAFYASAASRVGHLLHADTYRARSRVFHG